MGDEFRSSAATGGVHRDEAHQPGLQRSEQLEQCGNMGIQMVRGLGEDGLRRVDWAADRRKDFSAPGMPLIGGPKGADKRAGVDEIPNVRILHGWTGRWGREAAGLPASPRQKKSSSQSDWPRRGRLGEGTRREKGRGAGLQR